MGVDEVLERRGGRPVAESGDGEHPPLGRQVDHHRRDTGHVDLVALEHPERQVGGHACVHGVAAGGEYLVGRLGGQVVSG